jgi:SNF2 family DNA or RNA helicase
MSHSKRFRDAANIFGALQPPKRRSAAEIEDSINEEIESTLKHVTPGRCLIKRSDKKLINPGILDTKRLPDQDESMMILDENEDEVMDEEDGTLDFYDTEMDPRILTRYPTREHTVFVAGKTLLTADYLGPEYTEDIMDLHAPPPTARSPGLVTELHPYQEKGINMLIKSGHGKYRGAILADPSGLGKRVQALEAAMRDQRAGMFDLVVTTKSCTSQWKDEIEKHYDPVCYPNLQSLYWTALIFQRRNAQVQ